MDSELLKTDMRKKIDLIILVLILVFGFFAVKNAQAIGDWWHLSRYDPPSDVAKLAEDAGMSDTGKKLFYRFPPQLVSQAEIDTFCTEGKLGCTNGRSIYILSSGDSLQYKRNVVTAAHEMLHVAYSRFSDDEITVLQPLLEAELEKPGAGRIVAELEHYPDDAYLNEAHSYIGSQLSELSSQLEKHYDQFFTDRTKSTKAYDLSRNH